MSLSISPAARDALQNWLEGQRALLGHAEATIEAYRGDLTEFLSFISMHKGEAQGLGPLAEIGVTDMRSWMARMRASGVGARSLARKLSAVKSFYRWLAEREGFDPTAVLSARTPKYQRKLPRPLPEAAAAQMMVQVGEQDARQWVSARDTAVVMLLYGCGLRISEALSLTGKDAPIGPSLRIRGKGDKERIVPVIAPARDAVTQYLDLCPYPLEPAAPLFRAIKGGALSPRSIQIAMAQARAQMGLPASATPACRRRKPIQPWIPPG